MAMSFGTPPKPEHLIGQDTDIAAVGEHSLFKRCVQCPSDQLQCPSCQPPKICVLVPQSCTTCAHMKCIVNPNPPPPPQGPNIAAIAGGVVGGIAFVSLTVFVIWRFWIKKRREQQDQELEEEWANDEIASQKRATQFQDAASTRTRGSMANSLFSRASNFIQIAYIPGVTNRNGSARNSVHAPVPPIPAAHRQNQPQIPPNSPLSREGDMLFFGIDDLRGSTYSGNSSIRDTRYSNNRETRYTVNSITPSLARDSVASDVYWDAATTQPMPASTVARLAPRMVSVKSANSSPNNHTPDSGSGPGTPPDHLDDKTGQPQVMVPGQSSPPRGKATQVNVTSPPKNGGKGRFPVRQASDSTTNASTTNNKPTFTSPLTLPPQEDLSSSPLLENTDFFTPPAIQPLDSPFFDASEMPSAAIAAASSTRPNPYASMASTVGVGTQRRRSRRGHSRGKNGSVGGLTAVIEEATKRASRTPESRSREREEKEGPFGDENEVKEEKMDEKREE